VAGVLHKGRSGTQTAILQDREHRYASARIVGHENELSSFIYGDVTRIGAAGSYFIQQRQFAGGVIDREGTDSATLLAFEIADLIHCVKEMVVGVRGEKRWVGSLGRQADGRQLCIAGIETIRVDAFAGAGFLGVGADVQEISSFIVIGW